MIDIFSLSFRDCWLWC